MTELITPALVELELDAVAADKDTAIRRLVDLAVAEGRVTDAEALLADVRAREQQMATGLEGGIGIPHARSASVTAPTVVFGRSAAGVDFGAADGPARLVFLIAAPAEGNEHIKVLSALARRLVHQSFKDALLTAPDAATVVALFQREVVTR